MSDLIKTELELKGKAFCGETESFKKWVSFSWIENLIQNEIDRRASIGYSSGGLNDVISILKSEEEKK